MVVNTATNGRGPLLTPEPVTEGIEDLCNAPGRGMGPPPTTDTGFRDVDAFLWTGVPGNSSGSCGGGPPSGWFWPARALALAARAQGKLGPAYPADRY
ncbi:MAG: glycoside hydrolase family 6 protein [Solirubrobacteraceae bacterium]